MKLTNKKLTSLGAGIVLTVCSLAAYAAENHVEEALKHAETAVKTDAGAGIAEHAETARSHAKAAHEHLGAAITSLDKAITEGKQGHADVAKKAAEEAVTHLKAAE